MWNFPLSSNPTEFSFSFGNDSCSHLPFLVTLCLSTSRYANWFHNKSKFSALKQEIWFKHAYIIFFLRTSLHTFYQQLCHETNHSLVHYCCVWQLLCILAYSKLETVKSQVELHLRPWSHSQKYFTLLIWPQLFPHQVTLYWRCHSLKLQNIKLL